MILKRAVLPVGTALLLFLFALRPLQATTYVTQQEYLSSAFSAVPINAGVVWLRGEVRQQVEQILGHRYPALRIRYWQTDNDPLRPGSGRVWILEEIGKELPITAGFLVNRGRIENAEVLAFRESRGWEIRLPAFKKQFEGQQLTPKKRLTGTVDGISGATLSVSAMKRMARLALYLDQHVETSQQQ